MSPINLSRVRRILCFGAHSDDIEIGCGGTILRILQEHPSQIDVHWMVFSGSETRKQEAIKSANDLLANAKNSSVQVLDFPDSVFPCHWASIKEVVREVATECDPDLVFTHRLEDRHQDHRVLAELTWQHLRGHTILEYEIPKYEGDLGHPNLYFSLSEEVCQRKVDGLLKHFKSQLHRPWFDRSAFQASLRLRGIECNRGSGFAEAFTARKLTV